MATKEAFKSLVKALESFPKEKLTDLSFSEVQADRFRPLAGLPSASSKNSSKPSIKDIVSKVNPYTIKDIEVKSDASSMNEDAIVQQIKALNTLKANTYRDYYYPGDKLLRPQGNPVYYERLLADINGESKENIITGLRTVLLGK
jgi:cytochrome b pre-mRNA-processing protein 6